jgi:hypothetical protein
MSTLQISNRVHDFDTWKTAFDSYERFRADHGVRRYRVLRSFSEPDRVLIHLDFDSDENAQLFVPLLERIWDTPRSQGQLLDHTPPELLTLVSDRAPHA